MAKTVILPEDLYTRIKALAAQEGRSVANYMRLVVAEHVTRCENHSSHKQSRRVYMQQWREKRRASRGDSARPLKTVVPETQNATSVVSLSLPSLVLLWNEVVQKPEVLKVSGTREKHLKARMKTYPDLGWWRGVLEKLVATPFLRGEGPRGWMASFDWLVANDENPVRILEGKYDTAPAKPRERPSVPLAVRSGEIKANLRRVGRDGGDVQQDAHAYRTVPVLSLHAGRTADMVDAAPAVGGRASDAGDG